MMVISAHVVEMSVIITCSRFEEYFVRMVGRYNQRIITIIFRLLINPCDVETSLREHPAVLDCAVVSSLNQLSQVFLFISRLDVYTVKLGTNQIL